MRRTGVVIGNHCSTVGDPGSQVPTSSAQPDDGTNLTFVGVTAVETSNATQPVADSPGAKRYSP
jgi:hypothetical protein